MLHFLRRVWPVTTALTLAILETGCWEGVTRGVLATVLAVEGSATSGAPARGKSTPLSPGARVGADEIVETSGSSRVAISLLPNLLVQLDRGARIEILKLAITKDGNETGSALRGRFAEAKLMTGRMFVSQEWGEATARFALSTPHGVLITTSNALFSVEADEEKTRVTCVSGSVRMQGRGAEDLTRIAPGFIGEWTASNSSMVPAESDSRGQDELAEGLATEETLRLLIGQRRHLLPR